MLAHDKTKVKTDLIDLLEFHLSAVQRIQEAMYSEHHAGDYHKVKFGLKLALDSSLEGCELLKEMIGDTLREY